MAPRSDYTAGLITVAAGGTSVAATGTAFLAADIREGDELIADGWRAVIQAVDDNNSLSLYPTGIRGAALVASAYRIRYQGDGSRVSAQARELVENFDSKFAAASAGLRRAETLAGLPDGEAEAQPGEVTQGPDKGSYSWNGTWVKVGDLIDPPAVSDALGLRVRVDAAQGLNSSQKTQAKTNLDLQNVSNTADTDKPVSTLQATIEGRSTDLATMKEVAVRDAMRAGVGRGGDEMLMRMMALRDNVRKSVGMSDDMGILRKSRATNLPAMATDPEIMELQWSVSGRNLTVVPGRSALRNAGRAAYVGGTVDIPAPTSGHVDDEAITLIFAGAAYALAPGRLAHPNVTNVVVTGTAVPYTVNESQGVITRSTSGADQPVTVDYDWSAARYDLIEADVSGVVYRKAGTERERDVAEYVPRPTAGRIPLLLVRTTAWEITAWPWVDLERQSLAAPALIQRARGRGMVNLHKKYRAGTAVTIAGYGDSRTNLGVGGPISPNPYVANGVTRDVMVTSDFMLIQKSDFKSAITLYDHGDGAGQVHTHIGWNWDLLRAIQARYAGSHQYLNFGIGGTTTGSDVNNGTVTARLAALTSSGATIATIAFGMNELGIAGVDTTANLVTIGEACIAANIDPVFVAPARPNSAYTNGYENWLIECRQNKAAADYLGAPYVDAVAIYGADRPAILDPRDTCSSNLYNHDSVYELSAIGRLLTRVVLDI